MKSSDNDPNELLGRPGGYTSKAEVKQSIRESFGVENGGSVEVFETNEDAEKRKEYIETVTKEMGLLLTEYSYVEKNVLLLISVNSIKEYGENYLRKCNSCNILKVKNFTELSFLTLYQSILKRRTQGLISLSSSFQVLKARKMKLSENTLVSITYPACSDKAIV